MAILAGNTNAPISIKLITLATAQHFGLPISALRGPSREMIHTRPRQIAVYLCGKFTDFSLTAIGQQFFRDHTTMLHAIRKIGELVQAGDQKVIEALAAIEEAIEP